MTQEAAEWKARADDPAAWRKACEFRQATGFEAPTRAAYRAECLTRAEREVRVRRVILSNAGRRWLAVNSDRRARVNRA